MELTKILQKVLEIGGSDLFLIPGSPATAKVKGHLVPLTENKVAIFQRDPVHEVVIAQRDGWFDLYRWFFPPEPLVPAQPQSAGAE